MSRQFPHHLHVAPVTLEMPQLTKQVSVPIAVMTDELVTRDFLFDLDEKKDRTILTTLALACKLQGYHMIHDRLMKMLKPYNDSIPGEE